MQALFKVQIPQALPTIMTGVNQTLMMAMAMVVTCSMIGARGLGVEVLNAVNRIEMGRGIISGASVGDSRGDPRPRDSGLVREGGKVRCPKR